MAADIAVFDMRGTGHAGAWHDPVAALLFSAPTRAAYAMVYGKLVVEERRLLTMEEQALAAREV